MSEHDDAYNTALKNAQDFYSGMSDSTLRKALKFARLAYCMGLPTHERVANCEIAYKLCKERGLEV